MIRLVVNYPGGIDSERDRAIEDIVGQKPKGSGCMMSGERDIDFEFDDVGEAVAAEQRLRDNLCGLEIEVLAE